MDGFINLIKPAGMTSHDAVFMLRRILRTKKIGHTGTLDPMAMGVLPICLGKATRAAEYLEAEKKSYRCEMLLGYTSDTGDIWGNVSKCGDKTHHTDPEVTDIPEITYSITRKDTMRNPSKEVSNAPNEACNLPKEVSNALEETCNSPNEACNSPAEAHNPPDEAAFCEAIKSMKGRQLQQPPAYSAVRKNGRRLYEYERDGIEIEVEPKEVFIYEIKPVKVLHEPGRAIFDVECSKGTYVRTICEDIGRKLGTNAIMTALIRTSNGSFSIEEAHTFEEIIDTVAQQTGLDYDGIINPGKKPEPLELDISEFILKTCEMLGSLGKIVLNETEFRKFVNGGKIAPRKITSQEKNARNSDSKFSNVYRVYSEDGIFAGTAFFDKKRKVFTPEKVFFK